MSSSTRTAVSEPTDLAQPPARSRTPRAKGRLLIALLAATLVVVMLLAAGIGAFQIPADQVLGAVLHKIGLPVGHRPDDLGEQVLFEVRFPRVVLAALIGASLGCAGALMQGVFGNPLAEPGIIGVSSGAAVGAMASIVLGLSAFGSWSVTGPAFIGGLITVLVVYAGSRSNGRTEVVTLVLAGVAINTITGAAIGLITYFSNDSQLRSITFWNLGSVSAATWPAVASVAPCAFVGLLAAPRFARQL
ncbi:MAG: putative FecCD-family rane transport protein, partial [Pseudonocardiales bacterium]|nr:putative FecCD-family rane transport protein [Pseudonocardiales bacterium]